MITNLITLIIILGLPGFLIFAEKRSRIIRWIGPIILCYLAGILIANTHVLEPDPGMLSSVTEISVCLAIPLLLFSTDLKGWMRHARKTLLSFLIAATGVTIVSVIAYFVFSDHVPDANKVSGMMIGVYTGGTPNMSAIGMALNAEEEIFILLNSADIIISGIYFIFLLTLAKPFLRLFLPAFSGPKASTGVSGPPDSADNRKRGLLHIALGVTLSAVIVGAAIGLSMLITGEITTPVIILLLTTFAIGASFSGKVRNLRNSYRTAEYLLFVFAIAMGAMADIRDLMLAGPRIFLYCGFIVFFSIVFHFSFSALFRIDADTVIITSTAAIFGPAFVGPVSNAIRNPGVVFSGITMSLLGFACANYLGILVATVLK